jgi:hypothetical protein
MAARSTADSPEGTRVTSLFVPALRCEIDLRYERGGRLAFPVTRHQRGVISHGSAPLKIMIINKAAEP